MASQRIQELVQDGALTKRQGEVAALLSEGFKAREIADQLGITRNAVYSQINAIKKKGILNPDFTPTGEVRTPTTRGTPASAREILDHITEPRTPAAAQHTVNGGGQIDVIRELVSQNRMLLETVNTLVERLSKTS